MNGLSKATDLRVVWKGPDAGWVVFVPVALSAPQIRRIVRWTLKTQIDRWRSLPHGEARAELGEAITRLQKDGVSQELIEHRGAATAFASTERMNPNRTFFFGGSK